MLKKKVILLIKIITKVKQRKNQTKNSRLHRNENTTNVCKGYSFPQLPFGKRGKMFPSQNILNVFPYRCKISMVS